MFVLQLHPERIKACGAALEDVLENAIRKTPNVWLTQLKDIARWWREREDEIQDRDQ